MIQTPILYIIRKVYLHKQNLFRVARRLIDDQSKISRQFSREVVCHRQISVDIRRYSSEDRLKSLLKSEFSFSDDEASGILKHLNLSDETKCENTRDSICALKESKISGENVRRYPWLLTLSPPELKHKLKQLEAIGNIDIVTLSLLQLNAKSLEKFAARSTSIALSNKIEFLCREFELKPEVLAHHMTCHPFFINMKFDTFQKIGQTLKDAKVSGNLIARNFWIFRFPEKLIAKRLEQLRDAEAPIEKLWLLRADDKAFASRLEKWKMRTAIFGVESDHVDYLAGRLNCSPEYVSNELAKKNPRLLTINAVKLKEMLNLLFESGYTEQDICDNPIILSRGIATVKSRIAEIKALGLQFPFLKVISRPGKNYQKIINKLREHAERLKKLPSDGSTT